jgi:hypothetical protein
MKAPCYVATTANITLSGLQTIDGISVPEFQRVFVKDQTDGVENGIYNVQLGAWTRAADCEGSWDITRGTLFPVNYGTANSDTIWRLTTDSPILDSSALTFEAVALSGGVTSHTSLANIGVNTHVQIDSHISGDGSGHSAVAENTVHKNTATGNPHQVTLAEVGGTTDHTALSNIGTKTHAQIDSYLANEDAVKAATLERTGFPNRTDSTLSFTDFTRTLTIAPTGASFDIWIKGVKTNFIVGQEAVIDDTAGLWFIYFNSSAELVASQTPWTFGSEVVFVAIVYWNAVLNESILVGDERHGFVMDWATHERLHSFVGSVWGSGMTPAVTVDENGSLDAHCEIQSVSAGVMADEDIKFSHSQQTTYKLLYKEGASGIWRAEALSAAAVAITTTRPDYNEWTGAVWQRTEIANIKFTLTHLYATNDITAPYFLVMGENQYNTRQAAQDAAATEISAINLAGLPSAEFIEVATFIIECRDSYTNSYNARITSTADGFDFVDHRRSEKTGVGGSTNHHGNLTGLLEDDHTQYILADGTRALTGDVDFSDNELQNVDVINFNLTPTHIHSEGSVHWNADDKCLDMDTEVSGTSIQLGQESVVRCTNKTGATLLNGKVVYISGAQGNRPTIVLADSDNHEDMHELVGIVTHDIADNATGYVTTSGLVRDVDTSSWTAGTLLYASQTAGELTDTAPVPPAHAVHVANVVTQHATEGILLVNIHRGSEISGLHDVILTSLSDNDMLQYNSSTRVWENVPGSTSGYTGDLRDSTYTKIADVVNGLITAVDFPLPPAKLPLGIYEFIPEDGLSEIIY